MVDAHVAGELEPGRVDVGDDHLAGAGALGDQRAHDADRAGAGDQHVLADEVEGERGVHGIAEGVEDRGDLVGDVVGDGDDVGLGDRDVLGEGAGAVDADAVGVAAEVAAAGAAVAAGAADDVALAGDALAGRKRVTAAPVSAMRP